jgi:hypothetical protein
MFNHDRKSKLLEVSLTNDDNRDNQRAFDLRTLADLSGRRQLLQLLTGVAVLPLVGCGSSPTNVMAPAIASDRGVIPDQAARLTLA